MLLKINRGTADRRSRELSLAGNDKNSFQTAVHRTVAEVTPSLEMLVARARIHDLSSQDQIVAWDAYEHMAQFLLTFVNVAVMGEEPSTPSGHTGAENFS